MSESRIEIEPTRDGVHIKVTLDVTDLVRDLRENARMLVQQRRVAMIEGENGERYFLIAPEQATVRP